VLREVDGAEDNHSNHGQPEDGAEWIRRPRRRAAGWESRSRGDGHDTHERLRERRGEAAQADAFLKRVEAAHDAKYALEAMRARHSAFCGCEIIEKMRCVSKDFGDILLGKIESH
jgi:hypothetical protein